MHHTYERYLDEIENNQEHFFEDQEKQDAVLRRLELLGEAAKRVPLDARALEPKIPWKQIAGLRDVLIHDYDRVDLELVWNVIINDLPALKSHLHSLKQQLHPSHQ